MFNPSTAQLCAWLAAICGQAVLCILLLCHSNKSFGIFRGYMLTQTAFSLLALAAVKYQAWYFEAYYACTIAISVLVLMCALEIYRRVFGPRRALAKWVPEKTATATGLAMLAGIVFAMLMSVHLGGSPTKIMMKVEQALAIAGWASFAILAFYSRQLGLPWRDRAAKITAGFLLYLTVSILTVFVRSRSAELAIVAGLAQQVGYLIAVLWWAWTMRRPEPEIVGDVGEILEDCRTALDALLAADCQLT